MNPTMLKTFFLNKMSIFACLLCFNALKFNNVVDFSSNNVNEYDIPVKDEQLTFFTDSNEDFFVKVLDEKNNTVKDFGNSENPIIYNFFHQKGSISVIRKNFSDAVFSYSLFNSDSIYSNGVEHKCDKKIFVRNVSDKIIFRNDRVIKDGITDITSETGNVCLWISEVSEKKFVIKMFTKESHLYIPKANNEFYYIFRKGIKHLVSDQLSLVFNSDGFDNSSFVEISRYGKDFVNQYAVDFTDLRGDTESSGLNLPSFKLSRKVLANDSSTVVMALSILVGIAFYVILLVPTIIVLNKSSRVTVEAADAANENNNHDEEDLTKYAKRTPQGKGEEVYNGV